MKKNNVNILYILVFISFCFTFILFGSQNLKATEYTYESGNVEEVYDSTTVMSFDYDYISKFTAASNYYDGEQVYDGEKNLKDTNFYSGQSITVSAKHVNHTWIWEEDDDATYIYKYNSSRGDFNAKYTSFVNENNSITLDKEGLYKVQYVFGGNVKFEKYICITYKVHQLEITADEKYENGSAYDKFTFYLTIKDAYNLKNNKYYYSFGINDNNLVYEQFDLLTKEEKNSASSITSIEDRKITVDVKESYQTDKNEKKYLFVKVEKMNIAKEDANDDIGVTVAVSGEKFSLVSKLEGKVIITNEDFTTVSEKRIYNAGEYIYLLIDINAEITYKDLQYSLDGGTTYKDLQNIEEKTNKITIAYKFSDEKDYVSDLKMKLKGNSTPFVTINGEDIELNLIDNETFVVDVTDPVISGVNGSYGESEIRNLFELKLEVIENNLDKVYYYAAVCTNTQGDECLDEFDNNANIVEIAASDIENNSSISLVIDNKFGTFDEEKVILYVKVVDLAGNEAIFKSNSYVVDNVIVTSEDIGSIIVEKDIIDEGEVGNTDDDKVIGKSLLVEPLVSYNVTSVYYYIEGMEEKKSCIKSINTDNEEKDYFVCLDVNDYSFDSNIKLELVDNRGNVEEYFKEFKYNAVDSGAVSLGDYIFNAYNDKDYDAEISLYNKVGIDGEKLVLSEDGVRELYNILKLNNVPSLTNLVKSLIYVGEEEITLVESVGDKLIVPTMLEIIDKLGNPEKYSKCAFSGNECNVETYLKYEYKTEGIKQIRFVKVNLLDNAHKYSIENFNSNIQIDVKSAFNGIEYEMVTSFNVKLMEKNVIKSKVITFTDLSGNSQVVESIDTSKLGTYAIEESYVSEGISSYPLNYKIIVKDMEAPVVTLVVEDTLTIKVGTKINDFKDAVSVSDNYDENIEIKYEVDPEFNSNSSGKYIVSYWAVDSSGNTSDIVTRTIIVEKENNLKNYLIIGGIVVGVVLLIVVVTLVEKRKQEKM